MVHHLQPIAASSVNRPGLVNLWQGVVISAKNPEAQRSQGGSFLRSWIAHLTRKWSTITLLVLLVAVGIYLYYSMLSWTVQTGSSKQTASLWQLSEQLTSETNISYGEVELDSDEYESGKKTSIATSGYRARSGFRRLVGKDSSNLGRKSSVIRITSSDPTSNLCENPLQIELETSRRGFFPSNPFAGSTTIAYASSTVERSSSLRRSSTSSAPAPSRRRRESGRLLTANRGLSASPSPARSPLGDSVPPARPPRSRPVDSKGLSSPSLRQNSRFGSPAPPAVASKDDASPVTENASLDEGWTDEVTAEDNQVEEMVGSSSPSAASVHSFVSASSGMSLRRDSMLSDGSGRFSGTPWSASGTIPLPPRLPSILKRNAQSFRSASLREVDISYSLVQRSASLAHIHQQNSTFGASSAQMYANPSFASMFPSAPPYSVVTPLAEHATSAPSSPWLNKRKRQIKLQEPDWTPYSDVHDRARERLDATARAASQKRSASFDANMLGSEPHSLSADKPGDEFWFERFTQSTAAAGRDWDWRKRRARAAMSQGGFGALPADTPGNVGKTNVQLQKQQQQQQPGSPTAETPASPRKTMSVAPLISFTKDELPDKPQLTIDTDAADASGSANRSNPSNSVSLPLGGMFSGLSSPRSSPKQANSTPTKSELQAIAATAGVGTLNSAIGSNTGTISKKNASNTSSSKKGMGRMMRRRASTNAADEEAKHPYARSMTPTSMSDESLLETRRSLGGSHDTYLQRASLDVDGSRPSLQYSNSNNSVSSLSLPDRLSSLSQKVSLNNLRGGRRSSDQRRDCMESAPTSELVGQAEVATPEQERDSYMTLIGLSDSLAGPRSSTDAYGAATQEKRPGHVRSSSLDRPNKSLQPAPCNLAAVSESEATPPQQGLKVDTTPPSKLGSSPSTPLSPGSDSSSVAAALAAASSGSPPVAKTRTRTGSRSSILQSAGGAHKDLDRSAKRHASRTGSSPKDSSIRMSSAAPPRETAPIPSLQPEPAPMGMAARARSASLSSSNTSPSSSLNRATKLGAMTLADSADVFGMSPLQTRTSSPSLRGSYVIRTNSGKSVSRKLSSPPPSVPLPPLPGRMLSDEIMDAISRGDDEQQRSHVQGLGIE